MVETNGSKVANLGEFGVKIFEPTKLPDKSTQKWSLRPSRPIWLDKWNDFRLANWLVILESPEIILKSTQQLLVVA